MGGKERETLEWDGGMDREGGREGMGWIGREREEGWREINGGSEGWLGRVI